MKSLQALLKTLSSTQYSPATSSIDDSRKLATLCKCSLASSHSPQSHRRRYSANRLLGPKEQTSCTGRVTTRCVDFRQLTTTTNLPIIYLFTKDGCTLCDVAKEALRPHMHRFILKEVDITLPENGHWYELYKYEIPVFHIYEEFLFKHRVDFDALERGLEKYKDGFKTSD